MAPFLEIVPDTALLGIVKLNAAVSSRPMEALSANGTSMFLHSSVPPASIRRAVRTSNVLGWASVNPMNADANTRLVSVEHSQEIPGLVHVRLNRPDKLNSLTIPMLESLIDTAHQLRRDRNVRAVILSGAEGNFSAGLDFGSAFKRPADIVKNFLNRPWRGTNTFQEAPWAWRRLPFPVIAAVEGFCLGGGLQIALAADYRITTANSTWSILEAKWGLVPDMSGIQALKQTLPIDQAKRLAMTGEMLSGSRAVKLGLASEIAGAEHENSPVLAAEALASQIIERSPDSVAYSKRLIDETWTSGPRATFFKERIRQARLLVEKNTKIAREAALKKQRPEFRPRSVS